MLKVRLDVLAAYLVGKGSASRGKILKRRGQIGDAIFILREAQGVFGLVFASVLRRPLIPQYVALGPFHRIARQAQIALIHAKGRAAHPLPELWELG